VRPSPPERQLPTDKNRDRHHRSIVQDIADARFKFPNEQFPDLVTAVNEPEQVMSIGEPGSDLFPDIVVVREPGKWLVMSAEVETLETVSEEQAERAWLPISRAGDLILFVPVGCGPSAMAICKKASVELKGVRTYRYRPVWGLEINDVWPYPPGPLRNPPLPGFVKRMMGGESRPPVETR
jgi:hypothetical protein